MLDLDKQIETRSGHSAKILTPDGGGLFPLVGVWENEQNVWMPGSWSNEGYSADEDADKQLVNIAPLDKSIQGSQGEEPQARKFKRLIAENAHGELLLVGVDADLNSSLSSLFVGWGFSVVSTEDINCALDIVESEGPSAEILVADIVSDYGGLSGKELVERARAAQPNMEILAMVDEDHIKRAAEVMSFGVFDYFPKPYGSVSTLSMVRFVKSIMERLLEKRRLEEQRRDAEYSLRNAYAELEERVQQRTAELEDLNKQLLYRSSYDSLTGLANRSLLMERLKLEITHAKRNKCGLALMFIDLDGFKHVNDTLGHSVGDWLLVQASERFKSCLRESDTIARQGGDEFIILCSDVNSQLGPVRVAEKIGEAFREPFVHASQKLFVTPSIGISLFPENGDDPNLLLKTADSAMYHVKANGRNNYQFYTDALARHSLNRLRIIDSLHRAVEKKEFDLHFQPQMELQSGLVTGMEALLRWPDRGQGMIGPAEFIPVAEDSGLIKPIGAWVLQEACKQLRIFGKAGLEDLELSINFSPEQFSSPDLSEQVREVIDSCGLRPDRIIVEITEGTLMNNFRESDIILRKLVALGVKIAVDDFGTGYSSLAYLKRFPIHKLKIDRSFIMDIPSSSEDIEITRAIIAMAHSLNLKVVAEGVETLEQLNFLREQGCDEIQGYYLSKPLPAAQIITNYAGVKK